MAAEFSSLSVYRLRDEVAGRPIKNFADFIDPRKSPTSHKLKGHYDFKA
jgi:hypothetical protein